MFIGEELVILKAILLKWLPKLLISGGCYTWIQIYFFIGQWTDSLTESIIDWSEKP